MAALQRTEALAPLPEGEVFGRTHGYEDRISSKISYGLPFDKAIVRHIGENAKVFVIASKTLCSKTDSLDRLKAALGDRFKGVRIGMTPHTLYSECLEVAAEAKKAEADTVVTLGAGSIADAAKFVCCSYANRFETLDDLAAREAHAVKQSQEIVQPATAPNDVNLIMIPTSLSAGEHTPYAGITDGATQRKYQIHAGAASVVILDPWLCLHTPNAIWLQSGVRGIDHGVEHACSSVAHPDATALCIKGLQLLIPGLLACVRDRDGADGAPCSDAKARLNTQLGVALTIAPLMWGVWAGASHGIGHMLGPMGVGHGETSCILLPTVCRYNRSANGRLQAQVASGLWDEPACAEFFREKGLEKAKAELPDLLDAVIRALGMPRTLKEKGIVGEEKLQALAKISLNDFFLSTNPIPIDDVDEVMKILKDVEG